jgi:hypothetical protein
MAIYRTRYRDPKEHRWVSAWAETRVTAEFWRAEIERRFAGKKLEIAIDQSGQVGHRAVFERAGR